MRIMSRHAGDRLLKLESEKLVTWHQLATLRRQWKEQGKIVVFTNGVFDILHAGHVSYLQQAKNLGDLLVVGVNSDASVKRLKGDARPLQPEEDRAFVLAGLESVDYVTLFEQDTPQELIDQIIPDILVKGGDYTPDEIVGAHTVRLHGGKVRVIPFLGGRSTTQILEKHGKTGKSNLSETP